MAGKKGPFMLSPMSLNRSSLSSRAATSGARVIADVTRCNMKPERLGLHPFPFCDIIVQLSPGCASLFMEPAVLD